MLRTETGPLYGMVWPIFTSMSEAPASYFFCAWAVAPDRAIASTLATMLVPTVRILTASSHEKRSGLARLRRRAGQFIAIEWIFIHNTRPVKAGGRFAAGDEDHQIKQLATRLRQQAGL